MISSLTTLPLALLLLGACLAYAVGRVERIYGKKHITAYTALLFFILALVFQISLALNVWDSEPLTYTVGGSLLRMDALSVFSL